MKTLPIMLISAAILFTACKKPKDGEQGPSGPQGPQGPAGVVATTSEGFVKGTISGTRQDGTGFNSTFNYTKYWGGASTTLDSSGVDYTFYIARGIDVVSVEIASFYFTVPNLSATTATFNINNFAYTQSLGTNKLFQFFVYNGNTSSGTITGFSYNPSTGLMKGNYSITVSGNDNTSGKPATINGSFEGTATKIYYRPPSVKSNIPRDKRN